MNKLKQFYVKFKVCYVRYNTTNAVAVLAPPKIGIRVKTINYLKNVYKDYAEMLKDVQREIQDKPTKAIFISSAFILTYALFKNTPDEISFKEEVIKCSNNLMQVNPACQKKQAVEHFRSIEEYYNQGTLRYFKAGVFAIIYTDDFDSACSLYQTKCDYIQPTYLSLFKRIIDFGFMGKWWNTFTIMIDYDVNEENAD